MEVRLAKNFGFCFGVQRAIDLAEDNPNAKTVGPLIHNPKEIKRLKEKFSIGLIENSEEVHNIDDGETLIVRTHGILKEHMQYLKDKNVKLIDATCPYVTKPQKIASKMSKEGYQIIIFGDSHHPEVKGVKSYADNAIIVLSIEELKKESLKKKKIAILSQTTKKIKDFLEVVNYLIANSNEVRVFNTICNATFENQDAALELSQEVDIMIIIGGKNSSNTKQLLDISQRNCTDSYLIEDETDLEPQWFANHSICGVTAGASTPKWIIDNVIKSIEQF